MTRTSNPDASALEAAWAKLAAARWDDARTLFEESIAARETAEGLEGLSWAAWWLDDAERLFDARRRAHRLYSQRGDMPGAARMAIWLACDELDFNGAFAVAAGWLRRAHRLLGQLDDLPEHGWLAFFEGYLASARGDTAGTLDLAAAASSIGRRLHVPDLEILGILQGEAHQLGIGGSTGARQLRERLSA